MRLNIDKYIKDKLQSHKPPYDESLWKGIEQGLPPRVPMGKGSWLLPAAAAVVLVSLIPFLLKFNNLANKRAEIIEPEKHAQVANKETKQTNINSIQPSGTVAGSGNALKSKDQGTLSYSTHQENPSKIASGHKNVSSGNWIRRTAKKISNQLSTISDQPTTPLENEGFGSKPAQKEEEIANIWQQPGFEDADAFVNIPSKKHEKVQSRYIDRSNHNANTRWANWQSIFYPFWNNPAYTGSEGRFNFSVDDKIEVVDNGATINHLNNFAFDARLPLGFGAGIYYSRDLTPYSLQSTAGFTLSKVLFHIGNTIVKAGGAATIINNSLFYNELSYPDQIDPVFGFIRATNEKDFAATSQAFGINGGMLVTSPHVLAGLDVDNINRPHLNHLPEAAPLPRLYRATFGYRFTTGSLQWMPMVQATRQNNINQANATLTAVYKNKLMLTVAYQDIEPHTGKGNLMVYAGYDIKKHLRLFASYGYNIEWLDQGVNEQFVHAGIKYVIL